MKIGVSTAIFYPDLITEDAIALLAQEGFDQGEVFVNSFSEFTPEYGEKLSQLAKDKGFDIRSIHTVSSAFEPYLFDAYERRRHDFFKIYQDFLKFGEIVGAKAYTFHGLIKNPHPKMTFKDLVYIYEKMIYEGNLHGIALAQENVSWCLSGDLEFLKRLKDQVKEPLKFTLDIKQAVKAQKSPYDYLDIFGEDLYNLHLNDHNDKFSCLLPGEGNFDFDTLFEKVTKLGYQGPGIIEVYKENYENVHELAKTKKLLERISHKY